LIKFHIPFHYLWNFYVGSHIHYSDASFNDAVNAFAKANDCPLDSMWKNGDAYTFTCNTEDDFLILKLKHPAGNLKRV
jgi:hypothetical protein